MKKNNKLSRLVITGVEQSLKSKSFIILNIFMLIVTLIIGNFATIKTVITKGKDKPSKENYTIIIDDETGKYEQIIKPKLLENMKSTSELKKELSKEDIVVKINLDEEKIIKAKVTSNEYVNIKYYNIVQDSLNILKKDLAKEKYKLDEDMFKSLKEDVEIERTTLKVDNTKYKKYNGYITAVNFILYFVLIFLGSSIASTIGLEKISRTTEYMLTGINEKQYLWYNILQCNILFIVQAVLGAIYYLMANMIGQFIKIGFLGMTIEKAAIESMKLNLDMTALSIIGYSIIQVIIVGITLSIIQAVITSKVHNMTDVSSSTTFVIILVMIATMFVPNLINETSNVNIVLKALAYVPIFSLSIMPKLYLLDLVGIFSVILSIIISIAGMIACIVVGSKMFKRGLLDTTSMTKKEVKVKDELEELSKEKMKHSLFKVGIVLLIYVVLSNLFSLLKPIMENILITKMGLGENINYIIFMVISAVSLYLPYLYIKASLPTETKIKKEIKENKSKEKNSLLSWFFIGILGCTVIQIFVSVVLSKLGLDIDMQDLLFTKVTGITSVILLIMQVAVMPAIFEELLFRKGIIGIIKNMSPKFAILISAFAFGLMHANIMQSIFAFLMGLMLGYIYVKTKSLKTCMAIHFINNLYGAILMIESNNTFLNASLTIIAVSASIVGAIILLKKFKLNKQSLAIEKGSIGKVNIVSLACSQYFVVLVVGLYAMLMAYVQIIYG